MLSNSKLKGTRVYLAGPIDDVLDNGVTWRRRLTPLLEQLGIIVMDPTNKKLRGGLHIPPGVLTEEKRHINTLKVAHDWDGLRDYMRLLRHVDLRMVDICDFMIVRILTDVHMCGSYEELFLANREKKPILLSVEGGKEKTPIWLFGTLPHEYFFNDFDKMLTFLTNIANGTQEMDKRWTMLDTD